MNGQSRNLPDFPPKVIVCVDTVVLRDQSPFCEANIWSHLEGKMKFALGICTQQGLTGSLDPPEVAALRENREEGGVIVETEELLGIQNHLSRTGESRLYLLFLCRHVSGEPTPDNRETDKAAYFSLEELDVLDEPVDPFCEWSARRVLREEHHIILLNQRILIIPIWHSRRKELYVASKS